MDPFGNPFEVAVYWDRFGTPFEVAVDKYQLGIAVGWDTLVELSVVDTAAGVGTRSTVDTSGYTPRTAG